MTLDLCMDKTKSEKISKKDLTFAKSKFLSFLKLWRSNTKYCRTERKWNNINSLPQAMLFLNLNNTHSDDCKHVPEPITIWVENHSGTPAISRYHWQVNELSKPSNINSKKILPGLRGLLWKAELLVMNNIKNEHML